MPKLKKKTDENIVYARLQKQANMRWLYSTMAATNQPMRAVVEMMIEFCSGSKSFKVPTRQTAAEKAVANKEERQVRLWAKAAGEKP